MQSPLAPNRYLEAEGPQVVGQPMGGREGPEGAARRSG